MAAIDETIKMTANTVILVTLFGSIGSILSTFSLALICLYAVFSYLPLWGWRYAFFDYKAGDSLSMANFVGFKWFTELLKNPATVNLIAEQLGYSCSENFMKVFKQEYGLTPTQYRARMKPQ